jgi:hypothetical protein
MYDFNLQISTFTQILKFSKTWPGPAPPESTVHLQSSPWLRGYTLLSPSLYSQCAVGHSYVRIIEVLGLSEHVVSYKFSTHTIQSTVPSLTDSVGDTTWGLLSRCKCTDRSQIIIINIHQVVVQQPFKLCLKILKVFSLSMAKHTKHFRIKTVTRMILKYQGW